MRKVGFGSKLLFTLISIVVICFGIMISITSYYNYSSSEKQSKEYIKSISEKYSNSLESSLNEAILISKQIANKYQYILEKKHTISREETLQYMKNTLKNAKNLQGIWMGLKDTYLFPKKNVQDSKEIKSVYDKYGIFNPYVKRTNNGNIVPTAGVGFGMEYEWVKGAYDTKKEYIAKPYVYDNTLMTIIAYPIFVNGKYYGPAGTVFSLGTLHKEMDKLKIFDTGYIAITDGNCDVLSHPEKSIIGKNLLEIDTLKNDKNIQNLCSNIKVGKNSSFEKTDIKSGTNSFFYTNLIKAGETGKYWSVTVTTKKTEYLKDATFNLTLSIISGIITLLIIIIILFLSMKKLNKNLKSISNGLIDFFKFLNKESSNTTEIKINSNDEFGEITKLINTNVSKVKSNIEEENNIINNVTDVVNDINRGLFDKKITANTNSQALNKLKNLMNNMLENLEGFVGKDINKIQSMLLEYSKANFNPKLDNNSGTIGKEINNLNEIITKMLQSNQKGGLRLENSSKELTNNIQILTNNATSQAASLEETAASIEEITGNISNTNQKAQEMLNISSSTKSSANEGKVLASKTVSSMDQINEQVSAINEAITVIDQIAFQTNILSLNAAVEAATAGEAGKGFAVVAQEVRNLASRSAEAAKEIKDLVENATNKANEGKEISSSMIKGFNELETKIAETNTLIEDVSSGAKEQSSAMAQISDAINQLDKFTQENASIADKTNNISKETYTIASNLVQEANKSEFQGKE